MKYSTTSLPLSLLAAALTLAGCHRADGEKAKERPRDGTPVILAPVQTVAWDRTVSIIGTLFPKDTATLGAQVEGSVEKTFVEFGDRVLADQVLANIDTSSYEAFADQAAANLARAEAGLRNARQNFTRTQALKTSGIASSSDFDQGQAQQEQAEAEVHAAEGAARVARLNLERSKVKAPFPGAVAQRLVGRGDFAKVGTPLFELVNDAVLKFIFQVPERYGSLVRKGLPVTFNVDNYPGVTFTGSVYLISPSVTTGSRAFSVGALVTNTDFRLKASTFARGALVLEKQSPTQVVPLSAGVSFAGITKVFLVENGIARSRPVTVGRIRDGQQEITDGLQVGDNVIIDGNSRLTDGAAVTLQERPARPAPPATNALPAKGARENQ